MDISIWSDIACPWCFVGKRRIESALARLAEQRPEVQVELSYRSFELDRKPRDPSDQTTYIERLATKYGVPTARARVMVDNMRSTGTEEGIAFDFQRAIPANTFNAHQLLKWAGATDETGKTTHAQIRLKEALMAAHFEQGANLGSIGELLSVVAEQKLDVEQAASILAADSFAEDVRRDEEEARMIGITGVPFFVIGRFGVSGAQRPATLLDVMKRALQEQGEMQRAERTAAEGLSGSEGTICTPDSC